MRFDKTYWIGLAVTAFVGQELCNVIFGVGGPTYFNIAAGVFFALLWMLIYVTFFLETKR